ncbi:metallophosphoesterase [Chloroflexi bacterium TSY]|nr:metallophosphoesterase [Chloroflexi bacterium TSY]
MVHVSLNIPALPEKLTRVRFAQISDIHLGPSVRGEHLLNLVQQINRLAPDFLMLTGDFVTKDGRYASEMIDPLHQLMMPAYAVTGNHDCGHNQWLIEKTLSETPVHLLRNRAVEIQDGLWLAGLDDVLSGFPYLQGTLRDIPKGVTTLLMVHEPDYIDLVTRLNAPIVAQFSGHTHGGQIRMPRLLPDPHGFQSWAPQLPPLGRRYPIGLYRVCRRFVYTNRGIGFSGKPLRVNCRPEITLFTLKST